MSNVLDSEDASRAVSLIANDIYVNGDSKDVRAHEKWRPSRGSEPMVRRDESWDRFVWFFYVGEGLTANSGFRYTGATWLPWSPTRDSRKSLKDVLARIRDAGDPPLEDKWNAAVITYERRAGTGDLHVFYGADAENWHMTPANQESIAEAGLALFDRPGAS